MIDVEQRTFLRTWLKEVQSKIDAYEIDIPNAHKVFISSERNSPAYDFGVETAFRTAYKELWKYRVLRDNLKKEIEAAPLTKAEILEQVQHATEVSKIEGGPHGGPGNEV